MSIAAAAALLCSAGATPLAAQCMACVSSSACGPSSSRGNCKTECMGTICACSDAQCRPIITEAPVSAGDQARFANRPAQDQPQIDLLGILVRDCDGQVELLVYTADGSRLLESRLLGRSSEAPPPTVNVAWRSAATGPSGGAEAAGH